MGKADCPIARSLQVIGDWWSLLIIRDAFLGMQRFGEFQKSLGLAKNILSTRLKKLVEDGIVRIEADGSSTSRNRYVLTDKGERLHVVLIAIAQWGEAACFGPGELKFAIVDSQDRVPLATLIPQAQDGRSIGPHDFSLTTEDEAPRDGPATQ